MQIQKMLNRHKNLFRNKLSKFNNEVEMLISFLNEKNVIELKQTSFSFTARNQKAINEIFDFLLYQSRLQKIFLKQIFSTTSSTFVIWKNDKFKMMINLRKINIKLYSNVYSLFRQNTILNALDEVTIFSSINLIKSFF